MAITRRAVLRGALVAGAGTLAGAGAYGYAYERHALEVTRATVPVTGLPPALAGLRDRPHHRHPSQPLRVARRRQPRGDQR